MTDGPRISVLLPVRNGESTLAAAIDSIRAQTHDDWELVLVDDGSTDRTADIIEAFRTEDARIRPMKGPGQGLAQALMAGLERCRSNLVARMDADDRARPHRLARQMDAMRLRPGLKVLGCAVQRICTDNANLGIWHFPTGADAVDKAMPHGAPVPHPGSMFLRSAVLAVGGYRSGFPHAEDYDLWLRVWERHPEGIDNLPDVLLDYRMHPGSISHRHAEIQGDGAEWAWWCHRIRREGLPEPVPGPRDPWSAASDLPPRWTRAIRFALLLRRLAHGHPLPPAWVGDLQPMTPAETAQLHLQELGMLWRRRLLGRAWIAGWRAACQSPRQVARSLRHRVGSQARDTISWRLFDGLPPALRPWYLS